jgi:hypothetical protein
MNALCRMTKREFKLSRLSEPTDSEANLKCIYPRIEIAKPGIGNVQITGFDGPSIFRA